jgi:4-diphosphocytidyl-2-C-methyl-D-erythritol kinase
MIQWQNIIINDFEKSVFATYPLIAKLKKEMINSGAVYASMSGSGATVYGIFKEGELDKMLPDLSIYFCYRGKFGINESKSGMI